MSEHNGWSEELHSDEDLPGMWEFADFDGRRAAYTELDAETPIPPRKYTLQTSAYLLSEPPADLSAPTVEEISRGVYLGGSSSSDVALRGPFYADDPLPWDDAEVMRADLAGAKGAAEAAYELSTLMVELDSASIWAALRRLLNAIPPGRCRVTHPAPLPIDGHAYRRRRRARVRRGVR